MCDLGEVQKQSRGDGRVAKKTGFIWVTQGKYGKIFVELGLQEKKKLTERQVLC